MLVEITDGFNPVTRSVHKVESQLVWQSEAVMKESTGVQNIIVEGKGRTSPSQSFSNWDFRSIAAQSV